MFNLLMYKLFWKIEGLTSRLVLMLMLLLSQRNSILGFTIIDFQLTEDMTLNKRAWRFWIRVED